MQRVPIVIVPSNPVPCSQRPIQFLEWQDLSNHRASAAYLFRVCFKALQKFRVWDAELRHYRTWEGPWKLRWFHTDYVHGFPLLRIYGVPEEDIRWIYQARNRQTYKKHSSSRKEGEGLSRMAVPATSSGNRPGGGLSGKRESTLCTDPGRQFHGRR